MNGQAHAPPDIIDIEVCNVCNYRCFVCACGNGMMNRAKRLMPLTDFRKIADILIAEKIGASIRINCVGEPFMNPAIYEMLEYGFTSGLFGGYPVAINTNASLLDARKLRPFGRGLRLQISLDGVSPEIYRIYRNNKDEYFHAAMANIAAVAEAGIPATLFTLVTRRNQDHLEAVSRFGERVGLPVVFLPFQCSPFGVAQGQLPPGVGLTDNYVARAFVAKEDFDAFSPTAPGLSQYVIYSQTPAPDIYRRRGTTGESCGYARISWIGPGGEVIPCCLEAYYNTITFGNVIEENSFRDIWESGAYAAFRQDLADRARSNHAPCRICFKRQATT